MRREIGGKLAVVQSMLSRHLAAPQASHRNGSLFELLKFEKANCCILRLYVDRYCDSDVDARCRERASGGRPPVHPASSTGGGDWRMTRVCSTSISCIGRRSSNMPSRSSAHAWWQRISCRTPI